MSNKHSHANDGPLRGLRVVDCSRGTAGTRAGGILADYGADVIWVEPPGGDPYRELLAVEYSVFNRGKRSITLDLRQVDDRDQLLRLVRRSDVFLQSWRPAVASQLRLNYQAIHAECPNTVYCGISGFGLDGPNRDLPGYESLVHAVVGTMSEQVGHREGPIFPGVPFASVGAACLAVIGTLAALYRRHLDGSGRQVLTSLLDGALAYLNMEWGDTTADGQPHSPGSVRLVASSFECSDSEYIGVHSGAVGAFGRLMKVLGIDDRVSSRDDGLDMGVPLTAIEQQVLTNEVFRVFFNNPARTGSTNFLRQTSVQYPICDPERCSTSRRSSSIR